jgi:hypothetical protein
LCEYAKGRHCRVSIRFGTKKHTRTVRVFLTHDKPYIGITWAYMCTVFRIRTYSEVSSTCLAVVARWLSCR